MTVYYRPDSIEHKNEVEKQDKETLEAIQKAIEDAGAAAGNALAAADLCDTATERANQAAKSGEDLVKAARKSIDEFLTAAEKAEQGRDSSEDLREEHEDTRETQEGERQTEEASRKREEASRQTEETGRRERESLREANETERKEFFEQAKVDETDRKTSETGRKDSELARADAEGKRDLQEQGRVTAEQERAKAAQSQAEQFANIVAQWQDLLQNLGVFTIRLLTDGQYDPDTGVPTVEGETGVIYVTPSPQPGDHNVKIEWLYLDGEWEKVDSTNLTLNKVTTDDIDAVVGGDAPTDEDKYLNLTGLSNLWTKLTGWIRERATAFAATRLSQGHNLKVALDTTAAAVFDGTSDASIGVSGTLSIENGGTGAATAEAAWKALGGGSVGKIDLDSTPGGYLDSDGNFTVPVDKDTTSEVATKGKPGLMPGLTGEANKWLDANGGFTTPPNDNTTYSVVTADKDGLIPKYGGSTDKFWRDDGTYAVPKDTTYDDATSKTSGLMSAADKTTFDKITTGPSTSIVLANGTPLDIAAFFTQNAAALRTAIGLATPEHDGLVPKTPAAANAALLFANSEHGYTEPIRDV